MSRPAFLYRAIALESTTDEYSGEPSTWPGSTLGRASGYLSRSAAVEAGRRAGISHVIVRSEPVEFPVPIEVEHTELRAEVTRLRAQLAEVSA